MANPYIGLVNRQLVFARYQCSSQLEETNAAERLRNQGALYAGIWHLSLAYKNYIAEVGANYKLSKPELPRNGEDLCSALESMNKGPAEASELARLEREGFIAEILKALQSIEQIAPDMVAPAPSDVDEPNPLKLVDISGSEEGIAFGFEDLARWIQQFKDLVSRHREH
ncbi:MAG: hypothetical protein RLN82_06820, partial [Pseudomonadales bacterium]